MWAVTCSILLHILLAFIIPNVKFEAVKKPVLLIVELSKKPEPPPVVIPEPVKAEPEPIKPKIEPNPELKPITKPLPTPTVVKNEPTPYVPPPAVVTHQTEVIAAAPKIDAAPAPVATPEPPKLAAPSQEDMDDGYDAEKSAYKSNALKEIQNNLHYPKIAEMRHITGKAKVKVLLDKNGNATSVTIIESSGNSALDAEAVAVVKRSNLKQYMTEVLKTHGLDSFTLPVSFNLAD